MVAYGSAVTILGDKANIMVEVTNTGDGKTTITHLSVFLQIAIAQVAAPKTRPVDGGFEPGIWSIAARHPSRREVDRRDGSER